MTKVNAYRKKSASVIDPYKFSSTGSIIDLTGLTRYTDQELTAAIPNISASNNLNTALKILDGQIRKVNNNIPDLNTLATVARTGSYTDLSNKPTIPTATSQLTNDSGYLTSVGWTDVTGKPTSFTPASHNQASNTINAMTGYTKASASASISTTDSLNTAIGKLEYGLGTKLDSSGTAQSANKLATSRTIALTGAVTGSGTFNGSADLSIATTLAGIDASKITSGTIDIARIPKAAISNLKVVADDTARFKLTISDVQNGDTVKVTGTGKMYYVADDTKLAEEAGYEIYNATADWDSITNKPTSYTPAAHTQAASTITGLASVATTGSYTDLSNKPTIPSKVSQLTNDSGYLTTVSWNTVTNKPSTYTPAAHNQASNTINAMTGYAKPSTTSAITTTDSLNAAIGKLEYGLGTKLDSSATAAKATADATGQTISTTYIKGLSVSGKVITYTKGDGSTGTITTQDTNTTYTPMTGATSSADGTTGLVPAPTAGNQTKYLRADGTWATPTDTNTTYSAGAGISLSGTTFSNSGVRGVTAGSSANQISVNTGGTTTTITVDNVANAAAATKATQDYAGQRIDTTYIKGLSVSGKTITYTKGDGTTGTITTQDTDTKYSVMTGATADAAGSNGLVPAPAKGKQTSFLRGDGTWVVPTNTTYSAGTGISLSGTTINNSGVRSVAAGSSANQLSVNTNGTTSTITINNVANATAADSATKATQDSDGQQINSTYIKGLSVSGKTITYTKGDGTTGTITTQDTNTTYSAFKGATADAAGGAGLVPAPAKGAQAKYLRADGTWQTPPDTNTTYSAATSSNLGLVKIGSNISVSSGTISLTKANVTNALGYTPPTTDTNTHYTTHAKVGTSASATANAAASNGSVYLNILDDSTVRDSHLIKGAGATTVTSDANGVITISSTDTNTNTTYSAGTGISLSGTTFSNAGVRAVTTGSTNGTISVNTNGTVNNIAVKGLGSAAYSNTSAFAAASHSHSNYALKTDIPSVWDSSGHLVSPAGWKLWVEN